MHIVVFGVGAIGGFYGTMLSKYFRESNSSIRLSFIARASTYDALRLSGSKLICQKNTIGEMQDTVIFEPKINVYRTYSELEINPDEYTIVLLCVKSKDTIQASLDIKNKFTDKTVVLSIQNGVENEERIAGVLGYQNVIGALTTVAAETLEPGIYLQKGNYGLLIGELPGNEKLAWQDRLRLDIVAEVFSKAGINLKITSNIYYDLWSKLVWNAAFNPTSVYYEATVGQLLANSGIRKEIIGIMAEVKKIAELSGFKLNDDVDHKHLARTDVPEWFDFRTSMLQDFQQGKEIELDELLGVIVNSADKYNYPVPYSKALYEKLKKKLSKQASPMLPS
jgi:2-dehydropantoate 2-reductase